MSGQVEHGEKLNATMIQQSNTEDSRQQQEQ